MAGPVSRIHSDGAEGGSRLGAPLPERDPTPTQALALTDAAVDASGPCCPTHAVGRGSEPPSPKLLPPPTSAGNLRPTAVPPTGDHRSAAVAAAAAVVAVLQSGPHRSGDLSLVTGSPGATLDPSFAAAEAQALGTADDKGQPAAAGAVFVLLLPLLRGKLLLLAGPSTLKASTEEEGNSEPPSPRGVASEPSQSPAAAPHTNPVTCSATGSIAQQQQQGRILSCAPAPTSRLVAG